MDVQVHVFYCHTSETLVEMNQGTFRLYFGAPGSGSPLGSTSLSLLHLGNHVTLFYMDHAMVAIVSDAFRSHLVESIHEIQVLSDLYCCLYCHRHFWIYFIAKTLAEDNVITISSW